MCRFSVIIPCRDAEETLPETISSLIRQDFQDWRAVIVDDGSSDATSSIARSAARADDRIDVIRTEGVGPSRARNIGADNACGDWLAFLDADDLWPAERLTIIAAAIERDPHAGAFYGRCGFFSDQPDAQTAISRVKSDALSAADVMGENPVCTMSNLIVGADHWRRIAGLDPQMVHAEDLDLLLRLVASGARVEGLQHLLTHYRANPSGLSADLNAMERGWRACLARAQSLGLADRRTAAAAEARQLRYLARRALRLGAPGFTAARFALRGAIASPSGFFGDFRRGAPTFVAALTAPFTPKPIARALFAR